MKGKLYGIGVGPGDPELLTLKAKRILEEADVIAIPKTASDKKSMALSIAQGAVCKEFQVIELIFPMSFDSEILEDSWAGSVREITGKLDEGKIVAFVTLGDPTVYSTYMYIHKEIRSRGYETEIVPGITSFCASAARLGISLGENRESIAIIPSAYECDKLDTILDDFDNIVLMKVANSMQKLKDRLFEKGLGDKAVVVSKCGFEDENIEYDLEKASQEKLSYFSTMIVKRNGVR